MKHYVYLAGPISGLSYEGCTDWRDLVSKDLNSDKVECLTPLRGKAFLSGTSEIDANTEVYQNPITTRRGITRRDMFDTHRATCLFVNLLGAKRVSIGTCMEIAWAYKAQIPIIAVMEPGNVHCHAMIEEACTYIVPTLEEAANLTKFVLNAEA